MSFIKLVSVRGKLLKIFEASVVCTSEKVNSWHLVYEDSAYSLC